MARNAAVPALAGIPRVNLMPLAEMERRDRSATIRRWGWGIVLTLLALLLIVAGVFYLNWTAQQRLTAEQTRTNTLLTELASLSEVSLALRTQAELESFRADAMASDLEWTDVHSTLTGSLPPGVALSGFDLAVGGVPVEGADPAEQVGLAGRLSFTSPTPIEIAAVIRDYRALPGIIDADGWQVATAGGDDAGAGYTYELTITFDQTLYTGAYAEGGED